MAEINNFKGNAVLVLNPGERFLTSFGLSKAKQILENIDVIQAFVDSDGESIELDQCIGGAADEEMEREFRDEELAQYGGR